MPRLLNLDVMANPLNWATVFLMCAFGAILIGLVFPEPAASDAG